VNKHLVEHKVGTFYGKQILQVFIEIDPFTGEQGVGL